MSLVTAAAIIGEIAALAGAVAPLFVWIKKYPTEQNASSGARCCAFTTVIRRTELSVSMNMRISFICTRRTRRSRAIHL